MLTQNLTQNMTVNMTQNLTLKVTTTDLNPDRKLTQSIMTLILYITDPFLTLILTLTMTPIDPNPDLSLSITEPNHQPELDRKHNPY